MGAGKGELSEDSSPFPSPNPTPSPSKTFGVIESLFTGISCRLKRGVRQVLERLCYRKALSEYMVVFFSNILKIYAFSLNFPLVGSVVGGFYWLFLWNFKEIKHQPFSIGCVIENG